MSVYLDRASAYYSINLVRNRETIIPTLSRIENPLSPFRPFLAGGDLTTDEEDGRARTFYGWKDSRESASE